MPLSYSNPLFKPFHSDGLSHTYLYIKHGINNFVFQVVAGHHFYKTMYFCPWRLANSADPDEMPPYVAFHLGLHCLPKYLFPGIKNEMGKRKIRKFQDGDSFLPEVIWKTPSSYRCINNSWIFMTVGTGVGWEGFAGGLSSCKSN